MITSTRRWELVELDLSGTAATSVILTSGDSRAVADTFRRGDRLLARFAPDREGSWDYSAIDSVGTEVDTGRIECLPASADDHGPIGVAGTRFVHADGTPYIALPTTALWWHRQPEPERKVTIQSLTGSPITGVRMSILPPDTAAWPGDDELDRVEWGVTELKELNLQAELVIFGDGSLLGRSGWEAHLRRVVARFAGYSNVAWCLAMDADRSGIDPVVWDEALRRLAEHDHGHRLITTHAGIGFDFGDHRITHCSVRTDHARSSSILNDDFAKPSILDGAVLEGNAPALPTRPELVEGPDHVSPSTGAEDCGIGLGTSTSSVRGGMGLGPSTDAGNLAAEEVVLHAWETAVRGGHAAYGEWYLRDDHGPWWADGGELRGAALPRLALLRRVLAEIPGEPRYVPLRPDASTLAVPDQYYLQYLGAHRFRTRAFDLPDGNYRVELINTWDMTIEEVKRTTSGQFVVELPPRLYHAIRATRC